MNPPAAATTEAQRRRAFRLLFVCLMSTGVGNSMTFAVLPPLAREIALPDWWIGFIYTLAATLFTVMSQQWGGLSDRFGRRPVILIGLTGFSVSMIMFASAVAAGLAGLLTAFQTFVALALARAMFGGVGSASGAAAMAYVADRTSPGQRTDAIAALTAGFGVGAALGPGLAAWLAPSLGLVAPLYITAAVAGSAAVAVRFMLPERTPPKDAARPTSKGWRLLFDKRVTAILAFGAALWIAQATGLQTINFFVMDQLGVDGADAAQLAGTVLTSGALAMLTAQLGIIPRLHLRPRSSMAIGGAVVVAGSFLLAFADAYGEIVFAFTLSSLGMGLARPGMAAAASLAVDPDEQGAAAGLAASTAGIGFLAAPLTGLIVYSFVGPHWPYVLTGTLMIGATAVAVLSPNVREASEKAGAG